MPLASNLATEKDQVLDKPDHKHPLFIYVVTVLSAVGGFLFGYDTGVVSGAIILLRDYFSLNYLMQEVVVSVTIVAAWLFALISGFCTNKFGRKPVIIFASFVFTVGALLMGLAVTKEELIGGRFIVGAAIGLASMSVPMYIGEVAPADIRGRLVTINNCCITFGQLAACVVAGIFSMDGDRGWRYMLGLAAVPSVIQFFGFLFMPESPRWLIVQKRYDEAMEVLARTRGHRGSSVHEEFESIKQNCLAMEQEQAKQNGSLIIVQVLKNETLRRALLVGCSLQIIQQLAGINTVMYYSATIIQMSGVKDNSKVIWLSCATAAMNCVCSFAAFLFIEKLGRRILTLASLGGVILSLCFLAICFQVVAINSPGVTLHDSSPDEKLCSVMSTCATCTGREECGYCFDDTSEGPVNGSCLVVDKNFPEKSIGGACNLTDFSHERTWAYNWCPSSYSWLTLLGLLLYLFCFAPGMGSTPWTINAEIYPMWARSTCYSTATSFNWLFNFAVSISFLTLTEELTKYGAFWLYAAISTVGFVFLFFMLPETRGKSLEEVEALFARPWWKQMCTEDKTVQSAKKKPSIASIPDKKSLSEIADHIEY